MWGPQGPVDKDLKRRIKQKQSSEEEYELSRYKPLLRTVIEVPLHPSPLLWLLTSLVMVAGPRLRQARPHQLPVRQGLSSSYPHRIERAADANSNDLAAERKAELAPRGAHNQRGGGNPPAVALVRRGWDDILGDA